MSPNGSRQARLQNLVPDLTVDLSEEPDGSLVFTGVAYRYLTEEDEPYEYEITVKAADLPALLRALQLKPEGDAFAGVLAGSAKIVMRGEKTWLEEHGVPCHLHRWAPWVRVVE